MKSTISYKVIFAMIMTMNQLISRRSLLEILTFALPLIAGQVGQMLMGVGDMMVAGRHSKELVAAMGIANSCFGPFLMIGLGLSFAIGPMMAKKMGEGEKSGDYLFTTLIYCCLSGLALVLLMLLFLYYGLPKMGLAPNIEKLFFEFYGLVLFSIVPVIIFQGIKEYLQINKNIWFPNVLIILANISNLMMNTILTFGYLGFPALGIKGLAISTFLNRLLMCIALLYYVRHDFKNCLKIHTSFFKDSFKLGIPIAIAILMEVSIFTVVTVLIGKMDVLNSAAHNIILNIVSFTFMVPLAIGNAAATLVAINIADKNKENVYRYSFGCLFLSTLFMCGTALVFTFIPHLIIGIYSDKADLIAVAGSLIVFAALFQIPDGIQTTLSGILRGMRITRPTMILTIISYWGIGLPLGYYLAFQKSMMARGLWIGLAAGLATMSLLLFGLFLRQLKRQTA